MEISRIQNKETNPLAKPPTNIPVPLGSYVLIKPVGVERKTKGGIILTDESQDTFRNVTNVGEVLGISDTAYSEEIHGAPWFNEGDLVMWSKFTGVKFIVSNDDGEEVQIALVPYDHVMARIEDLSILELNGFTVTK